MIGRSQVWIPAWPGVQKSKIEWEGYHSLSHLSIISPLAICRHLRAHECGRGRTAVCCVRYAVLWGSMSSSSKRSKSWLCMCHKKCISLRPPQLLASGWELARSNWRGKNFNNVLRQESEAYRLKSVQKVSDRAGLLQTAKSDHNFAFLLNAVESIGQVRHLTTLDLQVCSYLWRKKSS